MMDVFASDLDFENEIRRVARLLWPAAQYDGAANRDGRERDGIFETEEFIHVIECTVSRAKKKAQDDFAKLQALIRSVEARHPPKVRQGLVRYPA